MCLVALAWKSHPRWRLLLAGNRDEFHQRPAAALAVMARMHEEAVDVAAVQPEEAECLTAFVDDDRELGRGQIVITHHIRDRRQIARRQKMVRRADSGVPDREESLPVVGR